MSEQEDYVENEFAMLDIGRGIIPVNAVASEVSDHVERMDFLDILPEDQAVQVRNILNSNELPDSEKEQIVCCVIKNRVALQTFKKWWNTKTVGNVDSFIRELKPVVQELARNLVAKDQWDDLENLLKTNPAASAAYQAWKDAKNQMNLVTEEDFLSVLKPSLRTIAEDLLAKNDVEGLKEVMGAPSAKAAAIIFDKWNAQNKFKAENPRQSAAERDPIAAVKTIQTAREDPELEYSSWAGIPCEAVDHLSSEFAVQLRKKTGCGFEIQNDHKGNGSQLAKYRVGGPSLLAVQSGLKEVIEFLGKIQKATETLEPNVIKGLSALQEIMVIELQRKHKICFERTHSGGLGLPTPAVMLKAWDNVELLIAKSEISKIIAMASMFPKASDPNAFDEYNAQNNYNSNLQNNQNTGAPLNIPFGSAVHHNEFSVAMTDDERSPKESRPVQDIGRYPKCMNILVLGETGVGKSTFINGMINYFKYETMLDALQNGVHILIKSSFTLTDDDYQAIDITSEATIGDEQDSKPNEVLGKGQSATQDPKSYLFSFGPPEDEKFVRIIDTPGIGDTAGVDQDKKNFQKILQFISQFSEIHAVCILIKPNTARLTLAFRFCIDELLVHLHRSASANLLFCFTNTRATLYKPGDTLPTLREHLATLKKRTGIEIPLNKQTLFSFDNESFRFLCALKEQYPFTDSQKHDFENSWKYSVDETIRMFDRITELPVHRVHDTLSLNNARNVILSLTRPLGEVSRLLMLNKKLIEDKMEEVTRYAQEGQDLRGKLSVEQVVMNAEEVDKPQTVCTAEKCVKHQRMSPTSTVMQTIFKKICHENCQLVGIPAENCPNTMLHHCWALYANIDKCRVCGCGWQTHMHIRYKLVSKMIKVEDPTVKASIANNDNSMKTANIFLAAEQRKVDELTKESEKITQYCAEFANFLSKHSILPYNDSYGSYIDYLVKEEQDKVTLGGSNALLQKLRQYKTEYDEQVHILTHSMNSKTSAISPKNPDDIDKMVKELLKMKNCGKLLDAVKNMEMLSVRKHPPKELTIRTRGSKGRDGYYEPSRSQAMVHNYQLPPPGQHRGFMQTVRDIIPLPWNT